MFIAALLYNKISEAAFAENIDSSWKDAQWATKTTQKFDISAFILSLSLLFLVILSCSHIGFQEQKV